MVSRRRSPRCRSFRCWCRWRWSRCLGGSWELAISFTRITGMPENALELRGLTKRFGASVTVGPIDLVVKQGEFVTLLGPSGCGKTTTLNMIGGFVTPDSGSIHLAGRPVETLPPFRRDLGIVFQDYALFPHRTVAENIGFGLRMRRVGRPEITRRVNEAMQLVRLDG